MAPEPVTRAVLTDEQLATRARELEAEPAGAVVRWAVDAFGDGLLLATSMEDAVLIDVAASIEPGIEVLFIDTGYHFPETLAMVDLVRERYGLNLRVERADLPLDDRWRTDPGGCCETRKVAVLEAALAGKAAWMTGLRRADSPERAGTPIVERDRRGLVKINPLAAWSDEDLAGYITDHDVPVNPLLDRGYASIGCRPCTRPVAPGEDRRAGRWTGTTKTECGLHL